MGGFRDVSESGKMHPVIDQVPHCMLEAPIWRIWRRCVTDKRPTVGFASVFSPAVYIVNEVRTAESEDTLDFALHEVSLANAFVNQGVEEHEITKRPHLRVCSSSYGRRDRTVNVQFLYRAFSGRWQKFGFLIVLPSHKPVPIFIRPRSAPNRFWDTATD